MNITLIVLLQGEYCMVYNQIYQRASIKKIIQFNLMFILIKMYLLRITELKENITFLIPFDNTFTVSKYKMINLYNIICIQ